MFALQPKMILIDGTWPEALPMFITAIIGMIGISAGFIGYIDGPAKPHWRLAMVVGGFLLIKPGTVTDIIGAVIVFGIMALHRFVFHKDRLRR
jgi:TRAP-type uncharacterized transport system fused permease subunit